MSALSYSSEDLPDRITSAVQPYFVGISEKTLELIEEKYPQTIKALFDLAIKLYGEEYGKKIPETIDEIGREKTQVESLFKSLNIPSSDWDALFLIFHRFVANLLNPSHVLIDLLLQMGHTERAMSFAKSLPQGVEQSKSWHDIVLHLSLNNHCAEAMKLVRFIKNEQEKTHAVTKIIDKLLENKQLDQAISFAKSLVDSDKIDQALEEVAIQLTKQDAVDRALNIINSMMDSDLKDYTLSRLVNILTSKGLFRKAILIAFSIEDQGFREDANGYIVKKLLSLRRIEEAIKFVERIENPKEKNQAAKIVESAMAAYHQDEKVKRLRGLFSWNKNDSVQ